MNASRFRTEPHRPRWWFAAFVFAMAAAFIFPAVRYAERYQLRSGTAAAIYLAFLAQLALALSPAFEWPAIGSARLTKGRISLVVLAWLAPYCTYAAGTGDFRPLALAKLLLLGLVPVMIYRWLPVREPDKLCRQDIAVGAWLIGAVLSGQLRGIWTVPVNLDFMSRLYLIAVATWCWTSLRPVPRLGYRFEFSKVVAKEAVLNFLYFAAIGVPVSLALGFTRWNPQAHGFGSFLLEFLQIFLFVALLEELFFRGFLQSLLTGRTGRWALSQAAVSVLFGLFHILHAPFPNWKYVLLATVAGWFYGTAYRKSGTVFASALTHAAVDTVWRTFLSAR